MKTTNEILTDIYLITEAQFTGQGLTGGIYKKTRPTDSQLEDTIISMISGNKAKFVSNGAIYIKTFFADINLNNTYVEDALRGQAIETLLIDLSQVLINTKGYFFEIQSREVYTEKVEEFHEHYAILKMNFQITND